MCRGGKSLLSCPGSTDPKPWQSHWMLLTPISKQSYADTRRYKSRILKFNYSLLFFFFLKSQSYYTHENKPQCYNGIKAKNIPTLDLESDREKVAYNPQLRLFVRMLWSMVLCVIFSKKKSIVSFSPKKIKIYKKSCLIQITAERIYRDYATKDALTCSCLITCNMHSTWGMRRKRREKELTNSGEQIGFRDLTGLHRYLHSQMLNKPRTS